MNRAVIDQFVLAQEYPEKHTLTIQGSSSTIKFSATGDYLASGTLEGEVIIYDCDTWEPIELLPGHGGVVQTLSWSTDSRFLLSASRDWQCILWDFKTLKDGPVVSIDMGSPVWMAVLHPIDPRIFAATVVGGGPIVVRVNDEGKAEKQLLNCSADQSIGRAQVALFSPDGEFILVGTSKGYLLVFNMQGDQVFSTKICSSAIMDLCHTQGTSFLVCAATDRSLRKIQLPDFAAAPESWTFEVLYRFIDLVDRHQWLDSATSASGEHILATGKGTTDVYMWESNMGSLVKIFEGPKENLMSIDFQPNRQCFATTGIDSGDIYIFTAVQPQNWSALATDFTELHANEMYIEREDEFDIIDENENTENLDLHLVDVWTIEKPIKHFVIPIDLD